jgi:ATP phosphoribosyltransferase
MLKKPESGETMKVAGLKAIDTVVESSAVLIQSRHPTNQDLAKLIKSRIKGYIGQEASFVQVRG